MTSKITEFHASCAPEGAQLPARASVVLFRATRQHVLEGSGGLEFAHPWQHQEP